MFVTKYIDTKVFDSTDQWGENLASIAWDIRNFYHCTIQATPSQSVFGRDMIFNLTSVIYWIVITDGTHQQLHDYVIGNLVYVEMNGIYHKLDYKK